ncbi:MAG: DUF1501 domain-containing protein [Planctomycetaceae bacterium]|nr:DUF1501 domain-containing protein [Planctomycetaceae bacterium]
MSLPIRFDRLNCPEFSRLSGCSRRSVLSAGTWGLLGASGLAPYVRSLQAGGVSPVLGGSGGGRAKRCIFLFMWGGPSQLDTFDMKPGAPAEVRGEFAPIATPVPGLQICEHFQQLAPLMDKVAVVRSLTHDDPAHLSSAHTLLTGHLPPVNKSDAEPPSERDTPHLGAMMSRLRPATGGLPPFITMPWLALHPAAPGGRAPGQHGGWLGRSYDPLLLEGDPSRPDWKVPALALSEGVTAGRLENRHRLLEVIELQQRSLGENPIVADVGGQQQQAFGLLTSPSVRQAFDLDQESNEDRDRYGRNIHGQCVLLARRLVEHGVPFVSVNWHQDRRNFWDTHGNNFNRLRDDLIPPADRALAALLTDLDVRGLLDETLVVWVGEFGRRPQIDKNNQAGRDHHPFCYSGLLAGGGVRGGAIYGRSDALASRPAENPVSPHDFAATILHAHSVDPSTTLPDRTGRPHHLYSGRPIVDLFG